MKRLRESGSLNSLALLLCMSFLSLLFLYSIQRYKQWQSLKKNLKQIICVKQFNKESQSLIKFIHRINQIMIAKNILQLASIFFPQTWVTQPSLARVKTLLKAAQTARVVLYYKDLLGQIRQGCRISLNALKSPFKMKGLKLERDYQGLTVLRSKKLELCHILSYQVICSHFDIPSSSSSQVEITSSITYLPRRL